MNKRGLLLVLVLLVLLALMPAVTSAAIVNNPDGTKSDTFIADYNPNVRITVTVPQTYSYCTNAPKTDTIRVTGLTGTGHTIIGWVQVTYKLSDGSSEIVAEIPVNYTTDFTVDLSYLSPWEWPVAADYGNGLVTKEVHVSLSFEVISPAPYYVFVYTFGPGGEGSEGLGWDVFCTGTFPPPPPPPPGVEGCTPGYWKNHRFWTNVSLASVYSGTVSYNLGNNTLLDALRYKGGSGVTGAARILLRAAAAAYLNSLYVDYPFSTGYIQSQVNAALASYNRETILSLATRLDLENNLGCPLGNRK
ncbi:MAG: hypothetical protein HZC41_23750 [Chloroflexi bacterium]|nr:hypothetical protein [Chloroflexota bacterium]